MNHFKRILFPTDFSSAAGHALNYAISLALAHEGLILLVHVIEEINFSSPYSFGSRPVKVEYRHGIEEKAREELSKVISPQLKRQIQVEEILLKGEPFVEIIRTAREKNADLIVIPSHAHPGIKHSHLGSNAERVIRKASCPVLVIRHPEVEFSMP
jgi:nucleotide-binding universal stress UspA family protein